MLLQGVGTGAAPAEGGADVVLIHLIQNGGAEHLHRHGHTGQGHGQSREEHINQEGTRVFAEGDEPAGNKDLQGDAEDEAQQNAHKDRGHRHADLVHHGHDPVQSAALPLGQGNAQGEGGGYHDEECQENQGGGVGELLHDHVLHRQAVAVGGSPVSLDESGHPLAVSDQHGLVKAQLGFQSGDLLRGGVGAQHVGGRGARDHLKGQEGKKGNDKQCNNESGQFAQDVFHLPALLSLSGDRA